MKKYFILLTLLFFGGCDLTVNLQSRPYFEFEDVEKIPLLDRLGTYYSISEDGVFTASDHQILKFDNITNTLRIYDVVGGATNSATRYFFKVFETDEENLTTLIQLYGEGVYKNHFMGISMCTNRDGSFINFYTQAEPTDVVAQVKSKDFYEYVSETLIHRIHKNYIDETAYQIDSDGVAVKRGGSHIAIIDVKEFEYDDDVETYYYDDIAINIATTTILAPNTEIMTTADGEFIAIEYDSASTKMKVSDPATSKDLALSQLSDFNYDFVDAPALTFIDYFEHMTTYGDYKYDANDQILLRESDGKVYSYNDNCVEINEGDDTLLVDTFGNLTQNDYVIIGTVNTNTGVVTVRTKKFIEWFEHNTIYDGYTYDANARTLEKDGTPYSYQNDDDYRVGTFGNLTDNDTILIATLDDDGNITVKVKAFIDYFEHMTTYGDYKYDANARTLEKDGTVYSYNDDGDMSTREGTFGNLTDNDTILIATIDDDGNITVKVKAFLDYFKDWTTYGGYTYHVNDGGTPYLEKDGTPYSYNGNGDMSTRKGTFGQLDNDGYGTILTATIDANGRITIEVSYEYTFLSVIIDKLNTLVQGNRLYLGNSSYYIQFVSGYKFNYTRGTVYPVTFTTYGVDDSGYIYIESPTWISGQSSVPVYLKFEARSIEEITSGTRAAFLGQNIGGSYLGLTSFTQLTDLTYTEYRDSEATVWNVSIP